MGTYAPEEEHICRAQRLDKEGAGCPSNLRQEEQDSHIGEGGCRLKHPSWGDLGTKMGFFCIKLGILALGMGYIWAFCLSVWGIYGYFAYLYGVYMGILPVCMG